MKIKEAFWSVFNELKNKYGENESGSILDLIFEDMGYPKKQRLIHADQELKADKYARLISIKKRLLEHRPVQYILGYAWFMEEKFFVNENVLIPRQETEELVELIINENKNRQINILDVGTGTGCIAISLRMAIPSAQIYTSDKSETALATAMKNAIWHKTDVSFIHDDILDPDPTKYPKEIDLIVSNPPYLTSSSWMSIPDNVKKYEPIEALFVPGNDPLLYYKKILLFAYEKLSSQGKVYFEINEEFGSEIKELLENNNFVNVKIIKDIHGKNRIAFAQKK